MQAPVTILYAPIQVSTSGNNNLVAATVGQAIRVLGYTLIGNGVVNVKFQSDGGGTPVDLTGLAYIVAAGGGVVIPYSPVGLFKSGLGKTLDLNLSGSVAVGGFLIYCLVNS